MTDDRKTFPNWEALYSDQQLKSMPWYNEKLDNELEEELEKRKINRGRFLDLGTGPGTQANKLYERGFHVTGSDISKTAIEKAKKTYNNNLDKIDFIVDDILSSNFKENEFDYIFDRGCFHVISINDRKQYLMQIKRILDNNGILFLKCFSDKEQGDYGPYRFSEDNIKEIFGKEGFKIQNIKETVYQGTLTPLPKALFVVIKKIIEQR